MPWNPASAPTWTPATRALPAILRRIERALDSLLDTTMTCAACGCLVRGDEVCPSCHPEAWIGVTPRA